MQIGISIIIPAYNVEKYLEECMDSILNQTYSDTEIICVDDGSQDTTLQILQQYENADKRVKIIRQSNAGAASARNVALQEAKGEYVYFMDADDILKPEALAILYEKVKEQDLDVLYFDGETFFENAELQGKSGEYSQYYIRKHDYSTVVSGKDLFVQMEGNKEYRVSPCMKIIRRQHLEEQKLFFHEGVRYEDNAFAFACILKAKRASHINERFYMRRVREGSEMTGNIKFEHAYGYYIAFCDMTEVLSGVHLSEEEKEIAAGVVSRVLDAARVKCNQLSREELERYRNLSGMEKVYFEALVVRYDKLLRDKEELKKWHEALKDNYNSVMKRNDITQKKLEKQYQKTKDLLEKNRILKEKNQDTKAKLAAIQKRKIYRLLCALSKPIILLKTNTKKGKTHD